MDHCEYLNDENEINTPRDVISLQVPCLCPQIFLSGFLSCTVLMVSKKYCCRPRNGYIYKIPNIAFPGFMHTIENRGVRQSSGLPEFFWLLFAALVEGRSE